MQRILYNNLEKRINGFFKRPMDFGGVEYVKVYGDFIVIIRSSNVSFNGKTKRTYKTYFFKNDGTLVLEFNGLRWLENIENVIDILRERGTTAITNEYLNNEKNGFIRIDNFAEKNHTFFAKVIQRGFGVSFELGDHVHTRLVWNLNYEVESDVINDIETVEKLIKRIQFDKK